MDDVVLVSSHDGTTSLKPLHPMLLLEEMAVIFRVKYWWASILTWPANSSDVADRVGRAYFHQDELSQVDEWPTQNKRGYKVSVVSAPRYTAPARKVMAGDGGGNFRDPGVNIGRPLRCCEQTFWYCVSKLCYERVNTGTDFNCNNSLWMFGLALCVNESTSVVCSVSMFDRNCTCTHGKPDSTLRKL